MTKSWLSTTCFSTFYFKPFYRNLVGPAILIHNLFSTSFCTIEMVRKYLAPIQWRIEMEIENPLFTWKKREVGETLHIHTVTEVTEDWNSLAKNAWTPNHRIR